jgi:hypothetical protein
MVMEYYVARDGRKSGPFAPEQLPDEGLAADTLVWHQGMGSWQRADAVAALACLLDRLPPPLPAAEAMPPPAEPRPADAWRPGGAPPPPAALTSRRARSAGAPHPPGVPAEDDGLSAAQYLLLALLFLCAPFVNVTVSSTLYYAWRRVYPRSARQANALGFIVFGLQMLFACLFSAFLSAPPPGR